MREILFRGKRNDMWHEGGLLYDEEKNKAFIAEYFEDGAAYIRDVIPDTVGQYTGLTDKYGKKIFEGDVIRGLFLHSCPVNSVVSFQDGAFGLLWERAGAETFWAFTSICNVEYEVIGNIHDNPELLKGE